MKKTILVLLSTFIYVGASCQDKDFYKKTNHYQGLFTTSIVFPDSSKMTSANIGSINWSSINGKPSVYPSEWSIVSNKPTFATVANTGKYSDLLDIPTTFPPATHNHDALYKSIDYIPTWADVAGKPTTFPPVAHNHSWNDITGKPNFATVATTGSYTDLLNVPQTFTPTPHTHTYELWVYLNQYKNSTKETKKPQAATNLHHKMSA